MFDCERKERIARLVWDGVIQCDWLCVEHGIVNGRVSEGGGNAVLSYKVAEGDKSRYIR